MADPSHCVTAIHVLLNATQLSKHLLEVVVIALDPKSQRRQNSLSMQRSKCLKRRRIGRVVKASHDGSVLIRCIIGIELYREKRDSDW